MAFALSLGSNNDSNIQTSVFLNHFLGSGDLKTNISTENSTYIFLRSQYVLPLYIVGPTDEKVKTMNTDTTLVSGFIGKNKSNRFSRF